MILDVDLDLCSTANRNANTDCSPIVYTIHRSLLTDVLAFVPASKVSQDLSLPGDQFLSLPRCGLIVSIIRRSFRRNVSPVPFHRIFLSRYFRIPDRRSRNSIRDTHTHTHTGFLRFVAKTTSLSKTFVTRDTGAKKNERLDDRDSIDRKIGHSVRVTKAKEDER